jgi:hypothetical protein
MNTDDLEGMAVFAAVAESERLREAALEARRKQRAGGPPRPSRARSTNVHQRRNYARTSFRYCTRCGWSQVRPLPPLQVLDVRLIVPLGVMQVGRRWGSTST